MEETFSDTQDIAEQRAILESIRLYESDQQYKQAIKRSMMNSKKQLPEIGESTTDSSDNDSSDSDSKSLAPEEIPEDFSSDEEESIPLVKSKCNISNDVIKKIKDELRHEILESLKNEQSGKNGKKKK
jgi:hypothetical protein